MFHILLACNVWQDHLDHPLERFPQWWQTGDYQSDSEFRSRKYAASDVYVEDVLLDVQIVCEHDHLRERYSSSARCSLVLTLERLSRSYNTARKKIN